MTLGRLRKPLLASSAVLALAGVLGWALLSTEWGTRAVWPFVEGRLPDGITVGSISGRLRSPLALRDIRYEKDGVSVHAESVNVVWNLGPLLMRTLKVRSLEVDSVAIEVASSGAAEPETPPALPAISLPLTAQVDRAILRRVSMLAADDPPLEMDSIDVRGLSLGERFAVDTIFGDAPTGRLIVSAWLEPSGAYPLAVELSLQGTFGSWEPVQGRVSVNGTVARMQLEAVLTQPLAAEASATVDSPRHRPSFDAQVVVSRIDAPSVRADLPPASGQGTFGISGSVDSLRLETTAQFETPKTGPITMDGTFHVSGTMDSLRLGATARFETPKTGPVTLDGVAFRADSTLRIESLVATVRGARLGGSGTVVLAEAAPVFDVSLGVRSGRWPLDGAPQIRVDTGWVSLQGTTESYGLTGGGRGRQSEGPSGRVALRGRGTSERFTIADLRLNTLDGLIRAQGDVAWGPEPSWDLQVSADDVDPTPLFPESSQRTGILTLRGRTAGRRGPNGTDGVFTLEEARAALPRGDATGVAAGSFHLPLSGPAPETRGPSMSFDTLDIHWGPNSLWAAGSLGDSLDLDLRLGAPDLGILSTDYAGALEMVGRVTGPRSTPQVAGRVLGHDLAHRDRTVEELVLRLDVDSEAGGVVSVQGLATGLYTGGSALDSLELSVEGTPEAHSVASRLTGSAGSLEVEAVGGVTDRTWSGGLQRFDFATEPLGLWRLDEPVGLALAVDHAAVDRGCWRSGAAQACLEGAWQKVGPTTFSASVRELDLERLDSSLPPDWELQGLLTADASVHIDTDSTLTLHALADLGSGRISYPVRGGRRELQYSQAVVDLIIDTEGTRASTSVLVSSENDAPTVATLAGQVELPTYTRLSQPLDSQAVSGRLRASMSDFSAIEAMLTSVTDLTGQLDVDVSVTGTLAAPEIEGEARLRDTRLDVPRLGMELRDGEVTAVGVGREGFTVQGLARSGSGTIHLSGGLPAVPSASDPSRMQVSGADFQAVNLPEASVWVSPDLEVVASPGRVDLTGTLLIPRARIELTEMPSAGISTSRDIVFVDDTAAVQARGPDIHSSVRIVLGDSLSFRGFGLTAEPRGSILATDAPGRATTATGEIVITGGRYRAYGQSLNIERGRVLYAGGPMDNPGLDIRATRRARDGVVAGLDVRGTLLRPDATLFSEPAMLQSDALAYIVLGRPLNTASASEGSAVAGAAASLGIRGGNVLAGRIAQKFGLEEIRIEAEGPLDAASLIAGKYLSPRLYVSYGVGLFEPINTFRMRYRLSSLWTLQAETGKATGADLMYRIERGR